MSGDPQRGVGLRSRETLLLGFAVLMLLLHADLARFEPEPYGTVAIDGNEVELFSPAGGSPLLIFAVSALLFAGRRKRIAADQPLLPLLTTHLWCIDPQQTKFLRDLNSKTEVDFSSDGVAVIDIDNPCAVVK